MQFCHSNSRLAPSTTILLKDHLLFPSYRNTHSFSALASQRRYRRNTVINNSYTGNRYADCTSDRNDFRDFSLLKFPIIIPRQDSPADTDATRHYVMTTTRTKTTRIVETDAPQTTIVWRARKFRKSFDSHYLAHDEHVYIYFVCVCVHVYIYLYIYNTYVHEFH